MTQTKRRDDGRAYDIGDLVALFGDESIVYKVEGYAKISESDGDENYQYEVIVCGEFDEVWIDIAFEDDMSLLARAEDAATFLRMRRSLQTASVPLSTDELLDDLSSLIKLRDSFGEGEPMRALVDEIVDDVKERLRKEEIR